MRLKIIFFLCVSAFVFTGCTNDAQQGTLREGSQTTGVDGARKALLQQEVPENPKCYTSCKEGFVDSEGEFRECSSDGLMEGCVDGATCVNGSCRQQNQPVQVCESDLQCPGFQICIENRCYSNCENHSDCPGELQCRKRACRLPCSDEPSNGCPEDMQCELDEGGQGHCFVSVSNGDNASEANGNPNDAKVPFTPGKFEVSERSLGFSNQRASATFTITNLSPRPRNFTVKGVDYSAPGADEDEREDTIPWVQIGDPENMDAAAGDVFEVRIAGNGGQADVRVELQGALADMPAKWQGLAKVVLEPLGGQGAGGDEGDINDGEVLLPVGYNELTDGRWAGTAYYFNSFGDENLAEWMDDKTEPANQGEDSVKNAFIHAWASMRNNRLTFDKFNALLNATVDESWRFASVREICPEDACYLYDNLNGYEVYSTDLDTAPVPSGVLKLPFAMDLVSNHGVNEAGTPIWEMNGRIVSSEALHYAGDPAIELSFETDPAECLRNDGGEPLPNCFARLLDLNATVVVGGRYQALEDDPSCANAGEGFTRTVVPWIVPGFEKGTFVDEETQAVYKYECRDKTQPYGLEADENLPINVSLAASNPIPDGKARVRELRIIDGIMVGQETFYILFHETFRSFLGDGENTDFSAYGVMLLNKVNADLEPEDYVGNMQEDPMHEGIDLTETAACDEALFDQIPGLGGGELSARNAADALVALIHGSVPQAEAVPTYAPEEVHYLCHETGLFDTGPAVAGEDDARAICPVTSRATFFAGNVDDDLSGNPCQYEGSCGERLDAWLADASKGIVILDDRWRCEDQVPGEEQYLSYCDNDRHDLRNGKVFFESVEDAPAPPAFIPIRAAVDNAFRYKTQFRNRQGTNIGFVPERCVPNSNAVPYCYDPVVIEEIQTRTNCIVHIFSEYYDALMDAGVAGLAKSYLDSNFSYDLEGRGNDAIAHDGFERLNAELLIMLGDEAYTAAFRSRFDLAGVSVSSFEGSKFEPGGINLSGVAGFEMYNLYRATQYYQIVLDRFYGLSPYIWKAVDSPGELQASRNFITQRSVTTYLNKLLRASTQSMRAWSEIAKRYQNFNRPDLARFVVERAYTSAYLESIVIGKLFQKLIEQGSVGADRAQIEFELNRSANMYRAAMFDMREVYASITDDINYFGFAPDYIPMPALADGSANAFEVLLARAKQTAQVAAAKEDLAIHGNRSFETDSASFQAELARIRNTYENQLAAICGTFEGDDGKIYPAIPKYAYLNERAKFLGDPCGLMGNGAIYEAVGAVEIRQLDIESNIQALRNVIRSIEIEVDRAGDMCDEIIELGEIRYKTAKKAGKIKDEIVAAKVAVQYSEKLLEIAETAAKLKKCSVGMSTDCPAAAVSLGVYLGKALLSLSYSTAKLLFINQKESEIADLEKSLILVETESQCDQLEINSKAAIKEKLLSMAEFELQGLRLQYGLRLAVSEISKLRDQASRLMAEQEESEQLSINVEAARNDPNVRIYKNDAVINAERTFYTAIRNAYRAAKVFEYYTSQSYERIFNLSLIRMVSRGDYNLELFLSELEEQYYSFTEDFGRPDARLAMVSLKDDVLDIPFVDVDGNPLTTAERTRKFQEEIRGAGFVDGRGYISIPFSTSTGLVSPFTRNHKLSSIRVNLTGTKLGDAYGRVYLNQAGTSVVHALDDTKNYFRFPERMAVINAKVGNANLPGDAQFTYGNDRLRDRPLLNTNWELILDQVDEGVNQDMDFSSLSDVRIFMFYNDFTSF